jgi:hypothetical protein
MMADANPEIWERDSKENATAGMWCCVAKKLGTVKKSSG